MKNSTGSAKIIVIILALAVVLGVWAYLELSRDTQNQEQTTVAPVSESDLEAMGLGAFENDGEKTTTFLFDFTGDGSNDAFVVHAQKAGSDASRDFYAFTKDNSKDYGCDVVQVFFGREIEDAINARLKEVRGECASRGIKVAYYVPFPFFPLQDALDQTVIAGKPLLFSTCVRDYFVNYPDSAVRDAVLDANGNFIRDCGSFELRWDAKEMTFVKTELSSLDFGEKNERAGLPLSPAITADPVSGKVPLSVEFSILYQLTLEGQWIDFGDGERVEVRCLRFKPDTDLCISAPTVFSHVYLKPGTYTVTYHSDSERWGSVFVTVTD